MQNTSFFALEESFSVLFIEIFYKDGSILMVPVFLSGTSKEVFVENDYK